MKKKIIIIGAGPVGCYTGKLLKNNGFDPLILEEHAEIGKPVHCTGLVGSNLFTEKDFKFITKKSVINTINGAKIHYDGESFTLKRKNVAYVVNREKFDKEIGRGLDIFYENRFIGLEKDRKGYTVITDKGDFYADILIGADGANSSVRRLFGVENKVNYFKGLQFRIKCEIPDQNIVDVYLNKPDFFWIVPESHNTARVGVISENPHKDLQDFMFKYKIKGTVLERFAGVVALGAGLNTVRDNIVLVGGAACQVKPLSYGGVYFGMRAAMILVDSILKGRLADYDVLWKNKLYSEIRIGLKLKDIYNKLSQQDLKKIFYLLKHNKNFIEETGNFESHSRLFLELLKRPGTYSQAGDLLKIIFKSVFN